MTTRSPSSTTWSCSRGGDAAPDAWRRAVYSDTTIRTQIEDGATELTHDTADSATPSSSNTAPSLVTRFLGLLDPYPGDRVLEIGTGTGWTSALLSHRLGSDQVTTIEVDSALAQQAQANLKFAGFAPHVVTADGAEGHREGAPYDRVHVTCGVARIPATWAEQTRPGGILALPWAPNSISGHRLTLTATGTTAVGRIHGDTSFMMMRSQRLTYPPPAEDRRTCVARVDPRRIGRAGRGLEIALAGLLPGVLLNGALDGSDHVGLRHPVSRSYAMAGGDAQVTQIGPRALWEQLEEAYLTWVGWGEPDRDRFGVIVDADGQHVWLDRPDNRISTMVRD